MVLQTVKQIAAVGIGCSESQRLNSRCAHTPAPGTLRMAVCLDSAFFPRQVGQLVALEYLVGVALPDKLKQTAVALKALYDEDVIEEVQLFLPACVFFLFFCPAVFLRPWLLRYHRCQNADASPCCHQETDMYCALAPSCASPTSSWAPFVLLARPFAHGLIFYSRCCAGRHPGVAR